MDSEYLHSQTLGKNRASLKRGMLVMDEELVEGDKLGRRVTMSWFLLRLRAEVEEGGRMLVGHKRRDKLEDRESNVLQRRRQGDTYKNA